MKKLLSILLVLIAPLVSAADRSSAPAQAAAPTVVTGEVLEVRDIESYTYLRLKTRNGETWAAVGRAPVKKGATVTIEDAMVVNNFESRSLKKTFPTIVFGSLAGTNPHAGMAVHRGVLSLLPDPFTARDVQPVGRLDHDTTGLLLLSDDGAFIHAQSHPKRHVSKTYVATTHEPVTPELVARLQAGVMLMDESAPLQAQARQVGGSEVEIVLDMGKYHQVKRMLAAAGSHCVALRRTAIGGLTLDGLGLAEGAWCYLEAEYLARLS